MLPIVPTGAIFTNLVGHVVSTKTTTVPGIHTRQEPGIRSSKNTAVCARVNRFCAHVVTLSKQ